MAPFLLTAALLSIGMRMVHSAALPYKLEQLEKNGVSDGVLAEVERLRDGGEKEVRTFFLFFVFLFWIGFGSGLDLILILI